ncbi:MAG: SRPBCC domain-containing protein [Actinoplanes sp.]
MRITNEFTVHSPIDDAWRVLTDLEGIAPCLPGAQLTGVDGDVYRGKVKIKVGPVISEFTGTAQFAEKDEAGRRAVIDAKGRDARSAGNAAAVVTAVLTPDGDSTKVNVDTDLKISGKLAQFGSSMIKEVSAKLLAQFVANLETKLAADDTPVSDAAASPADAAPAATGAAPAVSAAAATAPVAASASATETAAGAAVSPAPVEPPPVTEVSLNGNMAPVVAQRPPVLPDTAAPDPGPGAPRPDGLAAVAAPDATTPLPAGPEPKPTGGGTTVPRTPAGPEPKPTGGGPTVPRTPAAVAPTGEPEPLDLLDLAGGSIYKRLVPVVAGVAVVGAVIVWLVARR